LIDRLAFDMGTILPSTSGAMISSAIGVVGSLIARYFTDVRSNDVSAAGAFLTIQTKNMDGSDGGPLEEPFVIDHFADDKPPFVLDQVIVNETSPSYLGKLLAWKAVPLFNVSLSVIPNSEDDVALSSLAYLEQFEVGDFGGASYGMYNIEMVLTIPRVVPDDPTRESGENLEIKFFNGKILETPGAAGNFGSSSNASREGRLEGKTYKFQFTKCGVNKTPIKKKSWLQNIGSALIGT